jgi:hypothetical protein
VWSGGDWRRARRTRWPQKIVAGCFTSAATPVPPQRARTIMGQRICSGIRAIWISVLIFHNHPSGDPTPSPEDVELTRRLAGAGTVMGIDVVDHIILADVRYWSFKEMGQL